ncbi:MAG: SRPBCC family protein [Solirubrobacterales bacterium]|nr:SRPBCC family protein [Solirubrobacterales bacterium]MBV9534980.1 SRPBCC family protein [Solirubrobacterales bacterium]
MKVQEQFVVAEPASTVWEFFEQVDRVARCVPGVEDVTVVDDQNSRVRVTQAVGPMSATFDMKMRITARERGRSMEFTGVGRSVRGAAGNVRSTNRVQLEEAENGSTRVLLESDVALGGMLGSVGQKVVAKQASVVTKAFAEALEQELSGGPGEVGEPRVAADTATTSAGADAAEPLVSGLSPEVPGSRGPTTTNLAIAGGVLLVMLLILRRVKSR